MIVEQIPKKKMNILILILYIVGVQFDISLIGFLGTISTWATLIGWGILVLLFRGFYLFLQDGILSFEIKWIDGELHLERILGRGNHVYLLLDASELESFEPHDVTRKIPHTRWFCHRRDKEGLYLLTTKSKRHYVLQPSHELIDALKEVLNAQSAI